MITNQSFLIPDLLLYFSKLGNSFSNKIKTNKIQEGREGGRAPSSVFSGKGQTPKFGLEFWSSALNRRLYAAEKSIIVMHPLPPELPP